MPHASYQILSMLADLKQAFDARSREYRDISGRHSQTATSYDQEAREKQAKAEHYSVQAKKYAEVASQYQSASQNVQRMQIPEAGQFPQGLGHTMTEPKPQIPETIASGAVLYEGYPSNGPSLMKRTPVYRQPPYESFPLTEYPSIYSPAMNISLSGVQKQEQIGSIVDLINDLQTILG